MFTQLSKESFSISMKIGIILTIIGIFRNKFKGIQKSGNVGNFAIKLAFFKDNHSKITNVSENIYGILNMLYIFLILTYYNKRKCSSIGEFQGGI